MKLDHKTCYVLKKLNDAGYDAYVVGGCVRDILMNQPIHDIDITTSASPSQIIEVFYDQKCYDVGISLGTIIICIEDEIFDITTFRTEGKYINHRRPSKVNFCTNLFDDLSRRDFTINAMAYHPEQGLIDYFNGKSDIEARVIRTVNHPQQRFQEDALRMMRALRFSTTLNFTIDKDTSIAIHENSHLVQYLSIERVTSEFNKTLTALTKDDLFHEYRDIIEQFLPELSTLCVSKYHDIAKHVVLLPALLHLRVAALLIPLSNSAKEILERLKFPTKTKQKILIIIEHASYIIYNDRLTLRLLCAKLGANNAHDLVLFKASIDPTSEHLKALDCIKSIIEQKDCIQVSQLDVNGYDLNKIGIHGKVCGTILKQLLYAHVFEYIPNQKDSLLQYAQNLSYLGQIVQGQIDRPLGTSHPKFTTLIYPINYGYVEGVIGGDGEPQDVYLLGIDYPCITFSGVVIGIIFRQNDKETKWIVAPPNSLFSDQEILDYVDFQEQYFESHLVTLNYGIQLEDHFK